LPNLAIILKPGKVAEMIWIAKHFQTLLMSALIAQIAAPDGCLILVSQIDTQKPIDPEWPVQVLPATTHPPAA